jgi:hypothetical protein
LVSATRQSEPDPFLLEARSDFITTVHDNVLEVALGEDADGTEIRFPAIIHWWTMSSSESDLLVDEEEPLQVRKCFSTRKPSGWMRVFFFAKMSKCHCW